MKRSNSSTSTSAITFEIDLGDRKHAVCVLDAKGDILKQESIAYSPLSAGKENE
jgi:hypothetical protein